VTGGEPAFDAALSRKDRDHEARQNGQYPLPGHEEHDEPSAEQQQANGVSYDNEEEEKQWVGAGGPGLRSVAEIVGRNA
jgi:hypothetical protein